MKYLTGLDGVFLHLETPDMPMHVGSLSLLERPPGGRRDFLGDLRRLYARRLHLAPVLSRKLHEFPLGLANPVWVQAEDVDFEYHLRRVTLPRPGTRAQLETCVGALHATPLDRARPLWTGYVIEGLRDGRIAYYTNIHHAVVDGQAGVELMRALFDTARRPRRRRPAAHSHDHGTAESPWAGEVIAGTLRHDLRQYAKLVRNLPVLARTLARRSPQPRGTTATSSRPGLGPHTRLNVPIDGRRGFATASIPLRAAHALAAAQGATVNDVVLATCAGALRHYLGRRGGVPAEPLIAGMPVSLRLPGEVQFTTQATMKRISLATQLRDPLRRLHAIRDATVSAKADVSRIRSLVPLDFPTLGVPWLLHGLATLYAQPAVTNRLPPVANLVVSNVPGPPRTLYLAGARVVHHWPLSIVGHGLGLNVTIESYAGSLEFGVTVALAAVPKPAGFAEALVAAFRQLQRYSAAEKWK